MVDPTATSGSIGAGQQDPEDSNSEFWVISFIVRQIMAQLETMLPVQVVTFHAGSGSPPAPGTVDVQLLVSQVDGAGNAVPQGIVYGVSCFRLQGGPWAIVIDPAANDFGFLIAASRDVSNVVKNPGIQGPGSSRKYRYSDGTYLGGALNQVPKATIWGKSDGTLNITDAKGNVLQTSSSGFAMTGNLAVTGNITATGTIIAGNGTADQVGLQTHEHPTAGSGAPSPPTPGT